MKSEPPEPEDACRRRPFMKKLFKAAPRAEVADSVRREWRQLGAEAQPVARRDQHVSFETGHQFGRYLIQGELGRGGMGVVYRAHDSKLARTVAIKIYGRELADSSPVTLERFYQEARATARLAHPGIVRIYDAGQVDDVPFLSMDCVQGESLEGLLPELSLEERVRHLEQVARALDHAHSHGIVHRDVKPSNILIDPDGQAVLVDFGIARDLTRQTRLTHTGQLVGTVAYMSPEQVRGEPDRIGPGSDIYSLGVLLYQALHEALPHTGPKVDVMVGILHNDPPWPPPPTPAGQRLQGVVRRCLRKDTANRYPSAGALADDLARCLAGQRPQAESARPKPEASASPRRRSTSARGGGRASARPPWLAAAAVGLVGLCAILLATRSSEPQAPRPTSASSPLAVATPSAPLPASPAESAAPRPAPRFELSAEVEQASAKRARTIHGRLDGSPPLRLSLDGEAVSVAESGAFSVEVELSQEGATRFELEARDDQGRVATHTVSLLLDTTPPALRVPSPVAVVASATHTLQGTVEVADLDRLLLNGLQVEPDEAGRFELLVVFEGEGTRETVIEAHDRAGNLARLVHAITYDATPPQLVLDSPAEGELTSKSSVTLRGRVTDIHPPPVVEVREGETDRLLAKAELLEGGLFEVEVPLSNGRTSLTVHCQDGAGHRARLDRTVVRDSEPPQIQLTDDLPAEVFGSRNRRLRLLGLVDDPESRLTVNGRTVKLSPQGRFRSYFKLSEGDNPLEFVAVDRAGNRSEVSAVVHYGRRRPTQPARETLIHETFSAPPTAYDLRGTIQEGFCHSKTESTSSGKYMNKVGLVRNGDAGLFTYVPGAKLRFRIRLSKPLKGAFKLQLWSEEQRDNFYLYPDTPRAGEWVAVEIDLDEVRLHDRPQFAKESAQLVFQSVHIMAGEPGEDVPFDVDDLVIDVPAR